MATATLVNQEIEEGKRLIDALNAAGLSVDSVLWIYSSERKSWRLMLTSPLCDQKGTLHTYREIMVVFRQVEPELKMDWTGLVAVSPNHKLIKALRQLQQEGDFNLSGRRMTNNLLSNRMWVDDAYIYQIA